MRVLYVEDNELEADLMRRELARAAPHVELAAARTVADARRRLAADPVYDLLLTDLSLPDGNGLELVAEVRERRLPMAVVVLTGQGSSDAAVAALKAGADDYLVKSPEYLRRVPQALEVAAARLRDAAARTVQPLRTLYAAGREGDLAHVQEHLGAAAPHLGLSCVHGLERALRLLPSSRAGDCPYDVLVVDLDTWGTDVLDALKTLRDDRDLDLPVVLVTAQEDGERAAQALRLGVADYVAKRAGYLLMLPAVIEKVHAHTVLRRDETALREADEHLRRRMAQGAAVAELGRHALALAELDGLLAACVDLVAATLGGVRSAAIQCYGDELEVRAACGWAHEIAGRRIPTGGGSPSSQAVREQRSVLVDDLRSVPAPASPLVAEGIASVLAVPISMGERVWGVLSALDAAPARFGEADVRFVEACANVLASAVGRLEMEEHIRHQSLHDALTGVANRTLLLDRLRHALARADRSGTSVAVLFCDLDHFKSVNDALGHDAGDALLVEVARRLGGTVRPGDTIARTGGDEFVLVCGQIDDTRQAFGVAGRVLNVIEEPFAIGGDEVRLTVSIGVVVRGAGSDASDALRDADTAMYRAKALGRNRAELFDEAMRRQLIEHLRIESDLRHALERDELALVFQPIVRTQDLRLEGFEALVRWRHPTRGVLRPHRFIPIAEETGMIAAIGRWVIAAACEAAAGWNAQLPDSRPVAVNVNLSPSQLTSSALVDEVRAAVGEWRLERGQLTLEITESVLITGNPAHARCLEELRELGCRIVLDDFGTGYSSLGYLQRFPLDGLKLDRTFVAGLDRDDSARAIVTAITAMARALGLEVVAEGVERLGELNALRELGCPLAQGYQFSRPLRPERARALVAGTPPWVGGEAPLRGRPPGPLDGEA